MSQLSFAFTAHISNDSHTCSDTHTSSANPHKSFDPLFFTNDDHDTMSRQRQRPSLGLTSLFSRSSTSTTPSQSPIVSTPPTSPSPTSSFFGLISPDPFARIDSPPSSPTSSSPSRAKPSFTQDKHPFTPLRKLVRPTPSLPSLRDLARLNAYPPSLRSSRARGARFPLEPWADLDLDLAIPVDENHARAGLLQPFEGTRVEPFMPSTLPAPSLPISSPPSSPTTTPSPIAPPTSSWWDVIQDSKDLDLSMSEDEHEPEPDDADDSASPMPMYDTIVPMNEAARQGGGYQAGMQRGAADTNDGADESESASASDGYETDGGGFNGTGGGGGGRGRDDDGDGEDGRGRPSAFSDSDEELSDSEDESDPEQGEDGQEHEGVDNGEGSDDSEDDIPLAQRIPGALQAQRSIRVKARAERERRRAQKAAGHKTKNPVSAAQAKSANIAPQAEDLAARLLRVQSQSQTAPRIDTKIRIPSPNPAGTVTRRVPALALPPQKPQQPQAQALKETLQQVQGSGQETQQRQKAKAFLEALQQESQLQPPKQTSQAAIQQRNLHTTRSLRRPATSSAQPQPRHVSLEEPRRPYNSSQMQAQVPEGSTLPSRRPTIMRTRKGSISQDQGQSGTQMFASPTSIHSTATSTSTTTHSTSLSRNGTTARPGGVQSQNQPLSRGGTHVRDREGGILSPQLESGSGQGRRSTDDQQQQQQQQRDAPQQWEAQPRDATLARARTLSTPSQPHTHRVLQRARTRDGTAPMPPLPPPIPASLPHPHGPLTSTPGQGQIQGHTQHRVFIGDMQRFNNVSIGPATRAGDVVELVRGQGELRGSTISGAKGEGEGWMMWELAQDFGMERPLREYELPAEISASWNTNTRLNAFMLKRTPLAFTLAQRSIPSASPRCAGYVQWESKRGKWNKRWMELREHSLWLAKRDTGKDESFLCSLSNFDGYYVSRLHKAPKAFVFAVKSTDNLTLFENPADYLHVFACDPRDGQMWMERILLARSYVLHKERTVLFSAPSNPPPSNTNNNAPPSSSRSPPPRSGAPLVNVNALQSPANITTKSTGPFQSGSLLAKTTV